jgi:cell division protein FtsZ
LKLSEVNVASTLIQNSAHEDANIIFGAVLDEGMGDNVKITVIATGFRHDHMGRRHRVAGDAVPRVSTQERSSVPRFASEELAEQELTPLFESRKKPENPPASEKPVARQAVAEPPPFAPPFALEQQPVMIEEVPEPPRAAPAAKPPVTPAVPINFDEPFEEEYARLIPSKPVEERASLAGYTSEASGQQGANRTEGESAVDNLDIPAFLRRPVN